jgi:hypothetical protein
MHLFRGSLHSCIYELFFAWILVVLFCRLCRAVLPHLEESAILEHFISVMSSRCPCLRGPRSFSVKWSFLGFCLAFDQLFEFFVSFFSLSLLSELVTCVRCQCTHQGEIEDRSIGGPVVGRSWLWWVIDNVVWTKGLPPRICYNCRQPGHFANKCPTPRQNKPRPLRQGSKANKIDHDKKPIIQVKWG